MTPGLFNKSRELGPSFPPEEEWRPMPGIVGPPMDLGSVLFFWWL